jgi:hypothetical protein
MSDRLVALLLKLYPEEFRARFGPQIEADLYHPGTNKITAAADIVRSALYHRALSPGPYIWLAATILGAATVALSGSITLRHTYTLLQPRFDSATQLYALLFFAVFLVILSVLLLAIHWLQKCSKSKV